MSIWGIIIEPQGNVHCELLLALTSHMLKPGQTIFDQLFWHRNRTEVEEVLLGSQDLYGGFHKCESPQWMMSWKVPPRNGWDLVWYPYGNHQIIYSKNWRLEKLHECKRGHFEDDWMIEDVREMLWSMLWSVSKFPEMVKVCLSMSKLWFSKFSKFYNKILPQSLGCGRSLIWPRREDSGKVVRIARAIAPAIAHSRSEGLKMFKRGYPLKWMVNMMHKNHWGWFIMVYIYILYIYTYWKYIVDPHLWKAV